MRVVVQQLNLKIGDLHKNTSKIIEGIQKARTAKANLIVFSELTICGYPPEDLVLQNTFIAAIDECLHKIVAASRDIMVVVGLPRLNLFQGEKHLFNSACIICDQKIMGFYDKMLLPHYDIFNERRYFEPGDQVYVCSYMGKKIGVIICEDIWQHSGHVSLTRYEKDPILELQKHHIDLLLNLSASPYQFQKPDIRCEVCATAAKTLHCPVILCCQVGGNDQLLFDGYSIYVDKEGRLGAIGKGFKEDEMIINLDEPVAFCPLTYDPIHDLYFALVMGVRDYFYKQNFSQAIIGISGGIDSALASCIAVDALGKSNVLGVTMPSRYSPQESIQDAHNVARNLDISLDTIPVEKIFQTFVAELNPYLDEKYREITEENIQSRLRGSILMALSNDLGRLVLNASNKSELAIGYATLYGDMCGGLSILGDVLKTQIYELADWVNREKGNLIPRHIINKPPSAELRWNQKDTDTIPDYPTIDIVLQGYVEDYLHSSQISKKYDIDVSVILDIIKKIHKAEYKRRQFPPILRVSKKSFNVGRRYPIVQGWI